jgi:hypothetical protein
MGVLKGLGTVLILSAGQSLYGILGGQSVENLVFHKTAPFSLFCDDGIVARPFWSFEDAEAMVGDFPEHAFRIFERQADGTMRDIFAMVPRLSGEIA